MSTEIFHFSFEEPLKVMHTSRVTGSELCFRKISTTTEALVRVLDVHLGINLTEPHAHGFHHHLGCKLRVQLNPCHDARPAFPVLYRAPSTYTSHKLLNPMHPKQNLSFSLPHGPTSCHTSLHTPLDVL